MKRSDVVRIKLLSMGDTGVGKSCLIKWFCDQKFVPQYIPTVGIDYGVKQLAVGDQKLHLYFFDLAGGPDYTAVREGFYQTAHAAVLMYDTSRPDTFLNLTHWLNEANSNGGRIEVIVVVANVRPGTQQVSPESGRQWAHGHGLHFVEVTLANGGGVDHVFYWALNALLTRQQTCSPAVKASCHALLLQSS